MSDPWIIVAFSRPQFIDNLVKNFNRQIVKPRLIVVENGAAIGCCAKNGFAPHAVLTCNTSLIGMVRNVGIDYAKNLDLDAPLGFWDDDDVYGSRFIQESVTTLISKDLDLTMKKCHIIKLDTGTIYLCDPDDDNSASSHTGILGATSMVRYARLSPRMPDSSRGEDTSWGDQILAAGAKFRTTSYKNFCHVRHNDNITKHYLNNNADILSTFVRKYAWELSHTDPELVVEMQTLDEIVACATRKHIHGLISVCDRTLVTKSKDRIKPIRRPLKT